MISNFTALVPFLQLFSSSFSNQQNVLKNGGTSPFTSKFGQLVNDSLGLFHVPGVSIAVVDGENVWAEGYGIASFPSTAVTPSTLFYCGSTTKAFTAAALSLLVDDNDKYPQVQWNTPIAELIREDFVLENDYATAHTTIEDALSHRSGLPRHDLSYGSTSNGSKATIKDTIRDLRYLPLTAEPRTRFQYCNLMFLVATHVIETLTGTWLGDFLLENIWKPLDMRSTYFSTSAAQQAPEDLAQGYVYYEEKYQPVPYMDLSDVGGAGSIISNVLDYSRWLKAFINTSRPISKDGYKALLTSRSILEDDPEPLPFTGPQRYALGWFTGVYQGYEFFMHGGGMEAFGAEVIFFPALKYGIVAFGNTAVTSNFVEQRLIGHLIDEKLGIPEKRRFDWNKHNQKILQNKQQRYEDALKIFYPSVPSPPIPASLPLQNYTGSYYHPAYHNMALTLKDEKLYINRSDAVWWVAVDLEHVSGDHFMAYVDSTTAPGLVFKEAVPAEFKVSSDGNAKAFGIVAEPEMGFEKRIWFDRI